MNVPTHTNEFTKLGHLNFLWIELTNTCNLECTHCYADSSPHFVDVNPLKLDEYISILNDASRSNCECVQFIGGEPTLNKLLPELIRHAAKIKIPSIEVYTNLISISDYLISLFKLAKVSVATSIYSNDPDTHDKITTRTGSWKRTVDNIVRLIDAGIPIRVSFIEMECNSGSYPETKKWLHDLGVQNVGSDKAREFGRAEAENKCNMGELCGECSKGTLCIDPAGMVSPCIMSKAWPVGDIRNTSLKEIVNSRMLSSVRADIFEHTLGSHLGGCNPSSSNPCGPDSGNCSPCSPNGMCGPNRCQPNGG